MQLSPFARKAQLGAFSKLCDGGSIEVYEGQQLLATLRLPSPAFQLRPDGLMVAQPAPEEAAQAGRPQHYRILTGDGQLLAIGDVGEELTITPAVLRQGTRLVADALVLGLVDDAAFA